MYARTNCLYLEDASTRECDVTVIRVTRCLDDDGVTIVLDRTIFYPKSGGQPCDTGVLTVSKCAGTHHMPIDRVRISDGVVEHFVIAQAKSVLFPGTMVTLRIDDAVRTLNTRLHSAGELICAAVRNVGGAKW